MQKFLEIESQIVITPLEAHLLYRMIELAKEAGYTHIKDNWGTNVYDEYTIEEACIKYKPKFKDVLYMDDFNILQFMQVVNLNQFHGANIPHLQVLKSAAGFYIGDLYHEHDDQVPNCWLPNSRVSQRYWTTRAEAEEAFRKGNYEVKF